VWIGVLGFIIALLGAYYIVGGLYHLTALAWATVFGRLAVLLFFIVMTLLKQTKPPVILFGVIDAAGAVWTFLALQAAELVGDREVAGLEDAKHSLGPAEVLQAKGHAALDDRAQAAHRGNRGAPYYRRFSRFCQPRRISRTGELFVNRDSMSDREFGGRP
jgi:hypothetical protein